MKTYEETIDEIIEGIEIGLGVDDCHWSSIEKAVKLLKFLRDDILELEGFTEKGMEDIIQRVLE